MYMSRVKIDRENRRKIKDLSHVGAVHSWVEDSFPKEVEEGTRTRKLWRIDSIGGDDYLIVVSPTMPNLEKLEKYGVEGSAQTKHYDNFLNSLKEGMKVAFRITLNPVIAKKQGHEGKRGKVMPHITVEHQMNFLKDRSLINGFSLGEEDYTIVSRKFVPFKKVNQRPIQLSQVIYEGILTIENKEVFQKTLKEGFGKKKAYGFGLMTVIPLD